MKQTMQVDGEYLNIPVCNKGTAYDVILSSADGTVRSPLRIIPARRAACDFVAGYQVAGRFGDTVTIECDCPEFFSELRWSATPEQPADYDCPERQQFHYSAPQGWLNDPNGLFQLNGQWHLFHQHNPFQHGWGNMHWFHAVSDDLIHWRPVGTTLAPDASGMMFSGGAVVDHANTSGLREHAELPPVLLFYTAAGSPHTQCLAYSVDGGNTFRHYAGNPIVPSLGQGDRDPSVLWDEAAQEWVMALYLGDHNLEFAILTSPDLLHWQEKEHFTIAGGRECPVLLQLRDEADGRMRWVILEANGRYQVGDRRDGRFEWTKTDGDFLMRQGLYQAYAGQTFANAPDGKCYYVGWQLDWFRHPAFSQSMTLPIELRLRHERLLTFPAAAVEKLRTETMQFENYTAAGPALDPGSDLWEIELETPADRVLRLNFCGVEVVFDAERRELRIGTACVAYPERETAFRGRIFLDRNTIEIFDADGRFFLSQAVLRQPGPPVGFTNAFLPHQRQPIPKLTLHRLKTIWPSR